VTLWFQNWENKLYTFFFNEFPTGAFWIWMGYSSEFHGKIKFLFFFCSHWNASFFISSFVSFNSLFLVWKKRKELSLPNYRNNKKVGINGFSFYRKGAVRPFFSLSQHTGCNSRHGGVGVRRKLNFFPKNQNKIRI
jgi:hypothetical protein